MHVGSSHSEAHEKCQWIRSLLPLHLQVQQRIFISLFMSWLFVGWAEVRMSRSLHCIRDQQGWLHAHAHAGVYLSGMIHKSRVNRHETNLPASMMQHRHKIYKPAFEETSAISACKCHRKREPFMEALVKWLEIQGKAIINILKRSWLLSVSITRTVRGPSITEDLLITEALRTSPYWSYIHVPI